MNELIKAIEAAQVKSDVPNFGPGDTVRVHVKIVEGKRERIQVFEGLVIKRQGGGIRETFTVRKISFGVGVERTFPVHSPKIEKIEVTRFGKVRRAKINYIRGRVGKAARSKKLEAKENNLAYTIMYISKLGCLRMPFFSVKEPGGKVP